jgi:hypothetical protein
MIKPLLATFCTSLDEFLAHPMRVVSQSGGSAIAILSDNLLFTWLGQRLGSYFKAYRLPP